MIRLHAVKHYGYAKESDSLARLFKISFLEEVVLKLRLESWVGFEKAETEGRPSWRRRQNRRGLEGDRLRGECGEKRDTTKAASSG